MSSEEILQTRPAPLRRGLEIGRRQTAPTVGGIPKVSLLPPEIRVAAKSRGIRRWLLVGFAAVVLVAFGVIAAAAAVNSAENTRLVSANQRSQTLLIGIGKFRDIQRLQQSVTLGSAAARVGSSTEVDWSALVAAIEESMPTDYKVMAITADSASPIADYQQGDSPLELPRAATVSMTVSAPSLSGLPAWLRQIRSIPQYADATASFTNDGDTGGYTVSLFVHLNKKAIVGPRKEATE